MEREVDFKEFIRGLSAAELARFAKRAKVSSTYITVRLVHGYRRPGLFTLERLAKASGGALSLEGLAAWFTNAYAQRVRKSGRESVR